MKLLTLFTFHSMSGHFDQSLVELGVHQAFPSSQVGIPIYLFPGQKSEMIIYSLILTPNNCEQIYRWRGLDVTRVPLFVIARRCCYGYYPSSTCQITSFNCVRLDMQLAYTHRSPFTT